MSSTPLFSHAPEGYSPLQGAVRETGPVPVHNPFPGVHRAPLNCTVVSSFDGSCLADLLDWIAGIAPDASTVFLMESETVSVKGSLSCTATSIDIVDVNGMNWPVLTRLGSIDPSVRRLSVVR